MAEIDRDVAAFWKAALNHGPALAQRVREFRLSREAVDWLAEQDPKNVLDHGFRTLVLNRTRRGGVLAHGASLTRNGENGAGIGSRWYPDTLIRRLAAINAYANRITFCETDGMKLLSSLLGEINDGVALFIDPPYTGHGGKRAGTRLYTHNDVDHPRLFSMLADSGANFLMTYDCAPEIEMLVQRHEFHAVRVLMKNGHHALLPELVITRSPVFTPVSAYA